MANNHEAEITDSARGQIIGIAEVPFGWLVVDNEPRRNAVSLSMWRSLPQVLDALINDERVRVVMLRGAGEETFVAGADISEFERVRRDGAAARAYEADNAAAFDALRACPKPTIAMVRGFCMGGGLGLAAACDLRFVARGSIFSVPAAKLGVSYPPHAVRDLVKLMGPAKTKDLFYSARKLEAEEAFAIGLADRLIEADDLEAATRAYAAALAANAPLTQRAAKAAIDAVTGDGADNDWQKAQALAQACFDSVDFAEGRTAFMHKRAPHFTGR